MSWASATSSENQSLADRPRRQDMDDPREFLEEAAAAEEPEVFGQMRAEMTRIRASLPAEGIPLGDVGKVPSAAELLENREPDDRRNLP